MAEPPYYIFDPVQFKEYGHRFFQGDDFCYRYQLSKKFFWKNIYIPFGPVCKTEKGFENFLKHIEKTRFARVTIDLPTIYDKGEAKKIIGKLEKIKYKKIPYIFQDEETLLLFKDKLKLDSQKRNSVNHGYKFVDIVVKDKLSDKETNEIYEIYLASGKRIGFNPKTKEVFLKLSESCLVALAFGRPDKSPAGHFDGPVTISPPARNAVSIAAAGGKASLVGETAELEGYAFGFFLDYGKTDFSEKNTNKILLNMFTGESNKGREHKIGHAVHYELFKTAFEKYGADLIDLRGASRTKKRSYIHFKHDFSDDFYNLPGSFKKIYI